MKKIILLLLLIILVFSVYAGEKDSHKKHYRGASFLQEEQERLNDEFRKKELGTLTLTDIEEYLKGVSVIHKKAAFIERSQRISFMHPGMGQFINKDPLGGALFLTGNLLIVAGTLVGTYFLLPAELQFDQLDYYRTPISTIKDLWKGQSIESMLPAAGVMAGGFLLRMGLGLWSGKHAYKLAVKNVKEGVITFEPDFHFSNHGMEMGMRMRY